MTLAILACLWAALTLILLRMNGRDDIRRELARDIIELIEEIIRHYRPRLHRVRLLIGGSMADPITLQVGDVKRATLQGFDQFGASFPLDPASISFSDDNPVVVSEAPQADGHADLVALTAGTANIAGSSGGFSDSSVVTVAQPAPHLASVKLVIQ